MAKCLRILGHRSIDEPEQFFHFKVVRHTWQQLFKLRCGFGKMSCVIGSHSGLKLSIQRLLLLVLLRGLVLRDHRHGTRTQQQQSYPMVDTPAHNFLPLTQ